MIHIPSSHSQTLFLVNPAPYQRPTPSNNLNGTYKHSQKKERKNTFIKPSAIYGIIPDFGSDVQRFPTLFISLQVEVLGYLFLLV